jgi:hypothetical protein
MTGSLEHSYAVLGVKRDASTIEIDRAYRRAARATHPDVHPDEPAAGARFAAVAIADETSGTCPAAQPMTAGTRHTARAAGDTWRAGGTG